MNTNNLSIYEAMMNSLENGMSIDELFDEFSKAQDDFIDKKAKEEKLAAEMEAKEKKIAECRDAAIAALLSYTEAIEGKSFSEEDAVALAKYYEEAFKYGEKYNPAIKSTSCECKRHNGDKCKVTTKTAPKSYVFHGSPDEIKEALKNTFGIVPTSINSLKDLMNAMKLLNE